MNVILTLYYNKLILPKSDNADNGVCTSILRVFNRVIAIFDNN